MTTALVDCRQLLPDSQKLRLAWQIEASDWVAKHGQGSESFSVKCWTAVIADLLWLSNAQSHRGTHSVYLKSYIQAFETYVDMFKKTEARRQEGTFLTEKSINEISEKAEPYLRTLYLAYNRRLRITQKHGFICLLPEETQIGDQVSIFLGCPIPFVIRLQGYYFRMVGC
jgi:hypothetical protein